MRNSVVLIDFINQGTSEGLLLREAVVQSVAVRTRPILLIVPIAAFGLWSSAWLVRRLRSWWAARRESEPAHFRRVQAAIRGGDPRVITTAVMCWLDRLDRLVRATAASSG